MICLRSINKGNKMILTQQGSKIAVDSNYLLMASTSAVFNQSSVCVGDCCDGGDFERTLEVEFFVCGFDTVKDARKHGRKLQNYPGFESVWIIRRSDMEVVQPHEKF